MATNISVVIPVHDRAALLCRALDSVFKQTHPVDEIVVVDDGSSDDVGALVRERYPQHCDIGSPVPRLQVLSQPHRGVSGARNYAIAQSSGNWIAFLDSDDAWLANKIDLQLQAMREAPQTQIFHCNEIWIRDGVRVNAMKKHRKRGGRIYEYCLPLCVMSPSATIVNRRVFEDVGVFDEQLPACEDYDLWLRITARYDVGFVEQALVVKYGGHADQLSRRYWGIDRFRVVALRKQLANPYLSAHERALTKRTLIEKLTILANGAHKRNQRDAAKRWQADIERLDGVWQCPSIS